MNPLSKSTKSLAAIEARFFIKISYCFISRFCQIEFVYKVKLIVTLNLMTNAAIEGGDTAPIVTVMVAIDSGEIKVEGGGKADVQKFFSYFDRPVDVGSINLIVR